MRRFGIGVTLFATALVQVTWGPRLTVAGTFPNLILVAVMALTWTGGVRSGMAWACAAGILLDLAAPGPLGPHAMALVACAYLTGFWTRNVEPASRVQPVLAVAAGTVVYSLILVAADAMLSMPVPAPAVAAQLAGIAALYNAIFTPLALALVRRALIPFSGRVEPA